MQVYELKPQHDNRASFHGKATVAAEHLIIRLYSYNTHVATIKFPNVPTAKKAEVYGVFSQTTLRHIKEFLLQNGFKADNSKQIMADYGDNHA